MVTASAQTLAAQPSPSSSAVQLGPNGLSLDDAAALADGTHTLSLTPAVRLRIAQSHSFLHRLVGERRRLYGVTTGYGPLADSYIDPDQTQALQRNLIYHLASGVGEAYAPREARAILVARCAALVKGHSGASPGLIDLLTALINQGLAPVIPQKGTVGASGDLTPLAHLALAVMGEGQFFRGETPAPAAEILIKMGLAPYTLDGKDAIALVNGTSAMTGIAVLNTVRTQSLLDLAARLCVLTADLLRGCRTAWHPDTARVRSHSGQQAMADRLWTLSADSDRMTTDPDLPPILPDDIATHAVLQGQALPQDPYTLRCAPQALGAAQDVLEWHAGVTETELNAVTDNPLLFPDEDRVIHGGNFFGQHVAYASDALSNAVIGLSVHAERRIARLCDPTLNGGMPPFLQGKQTGLHSGFMGAQVTASALLGEMRTHAMPASIQSIPTNNNNQDIVTMGTIAARRCRDMLNDAYRLIAIEAMIAVQAFELQGGFDGANAGFSTASRTLAAHIREIVPFLDDDRPLGGDIDGLAQHLEDWAKT